MFHFSLTSPLSFINIVEGISWPIVDNLLFHYASHHNVLEKVVMYESELAAQDMRDKVRNKDDIIDSLAKDLEVARKSSSSSGSSRDGKKDSDVRDDIQGIFWTFKIRRNEL